MPSKLLSANSKEQVDPYAHLDDFTRDELKTELERLETRKAEVNKFSDESMKRLQLGWVNQATEAVEQRLEALRKKSRRK